MIFLTVCVCLATISGLEGSCEFPEKLRGSWRGLDDTRLSFTTNEITGFKLSVPRLPESDFECVSSSVDGDTTKYMLRAKETVTIFNIRPTLYMCLEIRGDLVKYYAIDTSKNPILQDHLFGIANGVVPTEQDVCDQPSQEGTYIVKLSEVVPKQPQKRTTSLMGLLDRIRQELERSEQMES